jgi:hypothetical protein
LPIVGGISPELASLGAAAARIQHRRRGKQPAGFLECSQQTLLQRAQVPGRMTDPVRQCGAVEVDPLTRTNLGLAIERQMVGIFGHQNLGHGRLGRQAALDQAPAPRLA